MLHALVSVKAYHFQLRANHICDVLQEIYILADRIGLQVPDIDTFIENLNSVGYLLKKGPKTYQVHASLSKHKTN